MKTRINRRHHLNTQLWGATFENPVFVYMEILVG